MIPVKNPNFQKTRLEWFWMIASRQAENLSFFCVLFKRIFRNANAKHFSFWLGQGPAPPFFDLFSIFIILRIFHFKLMFQMYLCSSILYENFKTVFFLYRIFLRIFDFFERLNWRASSWFNCIIYYKVLTYLDHLQLLFFRFLPFLFLFTFLFISHTMNNFHLDSLMTLCRFISRSFYFICQKLNKPMFT